MIGSRRILQALSLATMIATAPACLVSGTGRFEGGAVVAYDAPPPPREEVVDHRDGFVWVKGHWNWSGGQWVWLDGHWERERAGYGWQEGRWEQRGNQWHWIDGQWVVGGGATVTTGPGVPPPNPVINEPSVNANGMPVDHTPPRPANSMYPMDPPPPVQVESPGDRAGYVWVGGYYAWGNGAYQWTPGHWERPRANMVWQPGQWQLQGDHYVWIEGQWVAGPAPGAGSRDHRH